MKKPIYYMLFGVILTALIVVSCQQDEPIKPAVEEENLSEISLIEKQTGVSFFKHDITLVDESGKNKVTMRFAALNESMLAEYLKSRNYSITPMFERDKSQSTFSSHEYAPSADVNSNDTNDDYNSKIISEIVSQSLEEGAIGYVTHVKINKSYKSELGGRTQWVHTMSHQSPSWPEELHVQNYANDVNQKVKKRNRNISPWDTWWSHNMSPYTTESFNIDGPYKVCLEIGYNYDGDYSYFWVWD